VSGAREASGQEAATMRWVLLHSVDGQTSYCHVSNMVSCARTVVGAAPTVHAPASNH
jgi:hypothetical protein